ncbi:DUF7504 family protein [Halobacterium zhouii]|uniref:DUF7504 family protein n=1 Tax=Halobacterium zhouii TaxID=2902624 RepID=UPI001E295736|nr:hypothetical protein [Halobacterium zhouii]
MGKHADAEAFSRKLASLKRDGCNVLVVSDAAGRDVACERLLGAPELDRRHVFLSTSSDVNTILDRHAPRRTDANSVGVIDATPGSYTRSAAASAASTDVDTAGPTGGLVDEAWYERIDDVTDFEALLAASRDALDRVSTAADTAGDVRFCLDGLDPLFDAAARADADEQALFRFLHAVTSRVRSVDGMGHVHVSADIDDRRLATFEPLFDATIRVETDETGTVSQRWRLHDSEYVSDWFEL